jgi:hypothetical protein
VMARKDIHKELDAAGIKKITYKGTVIHPFPKWGPGVEKLFKDDYDEDNEIYMILKCALRQAKEGN